MSDSNLCQRCGYITDKLEDVSYWCGDFHICISCYHEFDDDENADHFDKYGVRS